MKYFTVEKRTLVGTIVSGEVDIDGDYLVLPEDEENNTEQELDYVVYEMDESGEITDTKYGMTLDQIKEQYTAENGWQNNHW